MSGFHSLNANREILWPRGWVGGSMGGLTSYKPLPSLNYVYRPALILCVASVDCNMCSLYQMSLQCKEDCKSTEQDTLYILYCILADVLFLMMDCLKNPVPLEMLGFHAWPKFRH